MCDHQNPSFRRVGIPFLIGQDVMLAVIGDPRISGLPSADNMPHRPQKYLNHCGH